MSIANKLVTIAENEQKVFNAGRMKTLKEFESFNVNVSGTAIAVNDVYNIEHDVECKLELRNLYDNTRTDWGAPVSGYAPLPIFVGVGNTVKVSYETDIQPSENNPYLCAYTENIPGYQVPDEYWLVHKTVASIMHKSITLTATEDYIYLQCSGTDLFKNGIGKELKVEIISLSFSDVEVSRLGKNLALAKDVYKDVNLFSVVEFEGRTAVRFLDNIEARWAGISFKPNTQYTVSFEARITKREEIDTKPTALFYFFYSDGTTSKVLGYRNTEWEHFTLTSTAGKTVVALGMDSYGFYNFPYIDCDSFQLEEGSTATAYEPYNRTIYQSTADGTVEGVTSISPNMTLISNNDGVIINANYLRDIDTYINNLITNVALTGGE